MPKALITGSKGHVGSHLSEYLLSLGWDVHGFNLRDGQDLRDYESVRNAIDIIRPTHIFHTAALAYVPESFANPVRAFEVNTIGSTNLFEAVRQLGVKCKVQVCGTSEEFGDTSLAEEPITEQSLPNPLSPYAISKLAMDHMARLYARSYGLHIVVTRAYNHTGTNRGEMYAESSFAKQIVEIENGTRRVLEHGNLESIRNYTDVRDIVKAYVKAIELEPGVYSICSDQNVSMQEVLDMLIDHAKIPIETKTNQALYRPADFSFKKPSCKKFTDLTSWKPEIPIEVTLHDILNDWRAKLA